MTASAALGEGIDFVTLTGLDQRCDHGPVLCADLMSGEECVLAVEGNGVVVDLDVAVGQED